MFIILEYRFELSRRAVIAGEQMNGKQRVARLLAGESTDRPPIFDLLRNDAVLSHLAGQRLTLGNAGQVVYRAMNRGVDSTRPMVRLPQAEGERALPNGRAQKLYRWTTWIWN